MNEEKKVVVAYVVKRYENGDIDVEDAKLDGTTEVNSEFIYKDIEDVAKAVKTKRIENAAYAGVMRFYRDMQAAEEARAKTAEEGK
jgi:hypothetical protein